MQPDRMLTLDEAMNMLADFSLNGRNWVQALSFVQLKGTMANGVANLYRLADALGLELALKPKRTRP